MFLNTDHKQSRDSLLLPFTQLQKLEDTDENIYCTNIIDRYAARPHKLEDMSLAQFAANYTYKRESNNDAMLHSDDGSEQSGTELTSEHPIQHQSIITLQNGLVACGRENKKP